MSREVLLSVIVPVYNGEAYIDRAMEGILTQTLQSLEVVAVNDGSKDGSLEKLREWEKKDSRVQVIDQENRGVSTARNVAMRMANGTYLTFLDIDDYLERDAYEKLIAQLEEKKAQAALCSFFSENTTEKEEVLLPWKTGTVLGKKEIWEQLIPWMIKVYPEDGIGSNIYGAVWRLCIKRQAWQESGVTFDKTLAIAEDFDFCIRLYNKLDCIVIVTDPLYHYIRWDNTTLSVYRKNQFQEGIANQLRLKAFLEQVGKYEQLKRRFIGSYVDVCIGSLVNFVRPGAPPKSQVLKELREVVNKIAEDGIYEQLELVPLTKNQKLVLKLIKWKQVRLILLFTKLRQKKKGK